MQTGFKTIKPTDPPTAAMNSLATTYSDPAAGTYAVATAIITDLPHIHDLVCRRT